MRVRATQMGYYNHKRVRVGQEFVLIEQRGVDADKKPIVLKPEDQFCARWMEKLDAEGDEAVPKAKGKAKAAKVVEAPEVPAEESVI
jgi:hypothetical protein